MKLKLFHCVFFILITSICLADARAGEYRVWPMLIDITKASVSDLEQAMKGPVLTKHQISTSVIVADGDYLVLGGLLKKKIKRNTSKLPFLDLFVNITSSEEEVEVLIMIRPRII
jgi:type II secretory pathway component GspD/PulD (secretin)